jgi:catechol 2,3-dioxygenase-like lactoylglutathione lyase family enzyme
MATTPTTPQLDGIHHVKLPVRDLARSLLWYESRLGYQVTIEFVEDGRLMGVVMRHPAGGPTFGLRLDPARAEASAGFDYFSIGVPSREAITDLAERLTALGEAHAGVHRATVGWILPELHDPDGHEVRFYTTTHHSEPEGDGVVRIDNPRETAEAAEAAGLAMQDDR